MSYRAGVVILACLTSSLSAWSLPAGAISVALELGRTPDFVSNSDWNQQVLTAGAAHALSQPVTNTTQDTLSMGAAVGYGLTHVGPIDLALELGYRDLGQQTQATRWQSGTHETLSNRLRYGRLDLGYEWPLWPQTMSLLARTGVAAITDRSEYNSSIANDSPFSASERATRPYLAAGVAFGGAMAQLQLLLEHIGLPQTTATPLAGGTVAMRSAVNVITLAGMLAF